MKVNTVLADLKAFKTTHGVNRKSLDEHLVVDAEGKRTFKGHPIAGCPETEASSAINKFIENLVDNLNARFAFNSVQS